LVAVTLARFAGLHSDTEHAEALASFLLVEAIEASAGGRVERDSCITAKD
jgi:hypothetical protein